MTCNPPARGWVAADGKTREPGTRQTRLKYRPRICDCQRAFPRGEIEQFADGVPCRKCRRGSPWHSDAPVMFGRIDCDPSASFALVVLTCVTILSAQKIAIRHQPGGETGAGRDQQA